MTPSRKSFRKMREVLSERMDELAQKNMSTAKALQKIFKSPDPFKAALEAAERYKIPKFLIDKAREIGRATGELFDNPEEAKKEYDSMMDKLSKTAPALKDAIDQLGDDPRYDNLRAVAITLHPEVRAAVGDDLDVLYRKIFARTCFFSKTRKRKSGDKAEGKGQIVPDADPSIPQKQKMDQKLSAIEKLLAAIERREFLGQGPSPHSKEYADILRMLVKKMLEADTFCIFKEDPEDAITYLTERRAELEKKCASESQKNTIDAYNDLLDIYRGAMSLDFTGIDEGLIANSALEINENFLDPRTGEKGTMPSPHQRIALYHLFKTGSFGIFDGCGTGKTATAALAKILFEKKLGRKIRTLVICPDEAKKAWKKCLMGSDTERSFAKIQNTLVINGGKKDDIVEQANSKDWVVVNYEQLITKVNGKTLAELLLEVNFDYVIIDEVHNLKKKEAALLMTNGNGGAMTDENGKEKWKFTLSGAARLLAHKSERLCLLSGTPMPDHLDDYAVVYSLLCKKECPDPSMFKNLYKHDPRMLFTFTTEKTVRRTAEDVNSELKANPEEYWDTPMCLIQSKLYEYIALFRKDWLMQTRKLSLHPKMVDKQIRADAGCEVSISDSAKFNKLVERLLAHDGPLAKGEKVVLFSTLKEGMTRPSDEMGIPEGETFKAMLEKELRKRFPLCEVGVLDGETSTKLTNGETETEREKLCGRFFTDSNLKVMLCTVDTASESIDLTPASTVIFLDEDYTPATKIQAIARVLRKGQKRIVSIFTLRCNNEVDLALTEHVDKKALYIKIALDGHRLLPKEEALLDDTDNKRFKELVVSRMRSRPINMDKVTIASDTDFVTRIIPPSKNGNGKALELIEGEFITTAAQQIMLRIGSDPQCWFDKGFVDFYCEHVKELSPWLIHRAKVCFFVGKAKTGGIEFPRSVVSMGSGPSLLYNAYKDLISVVKNAGFRLPKVTDVDYSPVMLEKCSNESKMLGNMTGKKGQIPAESVDMVDNESISLLQNREEVKAAVTEADRILRKGGLLLLTIKNLRFKDKIYGALQEMGYEMLTQKGEALDIDAGKKSIIRAAEGEVYAEAYARKLKNTFVLLARKGEPKKPIAEIPKECFWFEKLNGSECTDPLQDANGKEESKDDDESEMPGRTSREETSGPRKKTFIRTRKQYFQS